MFSLNRAALLGRAQTQDRTSLLGSTSANRGGGGGNFSSSGTYIGPDFSFHILEDIVNYKDPLILNQLFREIYMMDAVTGPAIDMMSAMPWSDFSLVGVEDTKAMEVYEASIAELNVQGLMKKLSVSTDVLGLSIGTLVFNTSKGIFTDCIMHNPDSCEITNIPLAGYDPKIDVKLDKDFLKFLKSTDQRDIEAKKEISAELLGLLSGGGKIPLEPLKTIYISRSDLIGTENMSLLNRILPIWILEKALLRGTIIASTRRQRSILHVQMGSDEWIPTDEQFGAITQLFANADRDPQGAIVATRNDITVGEVRNGSDFWKHSEENDGFVNTKLRALGLSESFMSGDATFNNSDASLTVFLENLKSRRYHLTNAVFRDKVFLLLAKYHGFRYRTEAELSSRIRYSANSEKAKANEMRAHVARLYGSKNLAEVSKYMIPEVKWAKQLEPKGNTQDFEMLKTLSESVPVSLAMLASAAGQNLDNIIESYARDVENRKEIAEYQKKIKGLGGGSGEGGEGGEGGDGDEEGGDGFSFESAFKEPIAEFANLASVSNKEELLKRLTHALPADIRLNAKQVQRLATAVAAMGGRKQ